MLSRYVYVVRCFPINVKSDRRPSEGEGEGDVVPFTETLPPQIIFSKWTSRTCGGGGRSSVHLVPSFSFMEKKSMNELLGASPVLFSPVSP
jgi:hypothetical protein